jgi:hypothetical protein
MQKLLLVVAMVVTGLFTQAQSFSIKGRLTDEGGTGLPSATILLLNARDSVMVNYALTDNRGAFEMKNVGAGNHLLRFSYMGFTTLTMPVERPGGNILDLGQVKLSSGSKLLGEVLVEQERIPMRVRNDTIEYDALAFKPLPNEMVEDLLKRMPGIIVGSDGSVEAQGETVRRVLVDGKEFFGRDPKMATQNLPADAVSKIHVFDEKSEQARFTGIDDGQRERTMNLELKEDRKEAAFGNTSLGYGPNERFQGRLNYNRFNKKGQLSILGMGNNLNQQGFSIGEYMNFSGNSQNLASGRGVNISRDNVSIPVNREGGTSSNGLMTSGAGGLNINRKLSTATEVTASYFYNQLDHDMTQNLERENFMPDGNFNFMQNQLQNNQNYNHRVNMKLDHSFSEKSSLLFQGSSSLNNTNAYRTTFSQTYNLQDELQNTSRQVNTAQGQNLDANGNLLWRQRLNKPGRTLTASLDFRMGKNDQDAVVQADNRYLQQDEYETIRQDQNRLDNTSNISTGITYTEPLGNKIFLETNYNALYRNSEVNQQVFDVADGGIAPVFNNRLSNHYTNVYTYHQGGMNVLINRERFNLTLGTAVQATDLKGRLITLEQDVNKSHLHILPSARLNYNFSNFNRLMSDYETSVREPSATQIQPVVDNRDPLNVFSGNPDLIPSYRHRMQVRYNSFNPISSFGYFGFVSADYNTNSIVNSVDIDPMSFRRTTMPVNVDKNLLNLRGSLNVNFALTALKSRIMVGSNIARTENVNVLNQVYQDIVNNTLGGNVRYNFRPVDAFELRLSANMNQQLTRYQFSTSEQAFMNQNYGADVSWSFLKNYRLQSAFNYQFYQGRTAAMDRKIPMLDLNLSRSFLRNESGELKFSVYNLLNQNLGVTQNQSVNYYEYSETNSLGRYFLLTFTYSLNKRLNMMEGRGRGGMMIHN